MLNIKNRLKKKKEFSYIYRKGSSFHTKHLTLHVTDTKYKNIKVGFSVSNKVGNSVVRHKIKRRLSEIVRQNIKSMPHYNYVISVKIDADKLTFLELKEEVDALINKLSQPK